MHEPKTQRIHLTFPEEKIQEPLIYTLATRFNIVTNIRRANVDAKMGWVLLEVTGTSKDLEEGFAYLSDQGVMVDHVENFVE